MSDGGPGTIVALDPYDALGWIELDGGGRVRFGGTALKGFRSDAKVGTRVEVRGTAPGFAGAIKALVVVPLPPPPAPDAPPPPPPRAQISWDALRTIHPRFSDATSTCVPCARPAPPRALVSHPLFDPWRDEIARGPTVVDLVIPDFRARDPIEAAADVSFALGRTAFLETPAWPTCGLCGKGMRLCVQLAPSVMADFRANGRGLVAMFCFPCGMRHRSDPRVGFVRFVTPIHRVIGPDVFASDAERSLDGVTQRVTARAPRTLVADASWLRYRAERVQGTASSVIFGMPELVGPFPDGVDPEEMLDDVGATFDDWLTEGPAAGGIWGGARLGGVPRWDQCDATPSCAHGEQLHLLDHEGGQFLDGALHVFVCRAGACEPLFVAEF